MSIRENQQPKVLVVDDDAQLRKQLKWSLRDEFDVSESPSRADACEQLRSESFDVVLSDLHLPPRDKDIGEGLAIIEVARRLSPPVPVVVITGSNSKVAALEAVKRGAYGFFQKPFEADEVSHILRQAVRLRRLEEEIVRLRSDYLPQRGFGRLIGGSDALLRLTKQAMAVADTPARVLITGENGTGKELLARAIHETSGRAERPFVAVSCGALAESVIESELFGHEQGAFTGAVTMRRGRFESAEGGTLFLDEVSEISPAVQVKLLRVLQQREIERVGSNIPLSVDVRVISASNVDLEKAVEEGKFRQDLYFRLCVVPLRMPALRERVDDVPVLAAYFANKTATGYGRAVPEIEPALIDALIEYDWPGNVRELENLIEKLVALSPPGKLGVEFLPDNMLLTQPGSPSNDDSSFVGAIRSFKRQLILGALQSESGNRVAAAKRLGMSRSYLHKLISEFGIAESE